MCHIISRLKIGEAVIIGAYVIVEFKQIKNYLIKFHMFRGICDYLVNYLLVIIYIDILLEKCIQFIITCKTVQQFCENRVIFFNSVEMEVYKIAH